MSGTTTTVKVTQPSSRVIINNPNPATPVRVTTGGQQPFRVESAADVLILSPPQDGEVLTWNGAAGIFNLQIPPAAQGTALAQAAFNQANSANILAQAAFNEANSANILAQAAFNKANTGTSIGNVNNAITIVTGPGLTVNSITTFTVVANGTFVLDANAASIGAPGIVQLNDTLLSNSNTQAATANAANALDTLLIEVNTFAQGAYNTANSAENLALSSFSEANGFQSVINSAFATANVAFSAYNRANSSIAGQLTFITTPGLTVNTGTSITFSPNATIVFGANAATTTQVGVVQLTDNVDSNLVTTAATANSVNTVWAIAQSAFSEANAFQSVINSAFATANVTSSIYPTVNSHTNLIASVFAEANGFQSVINSAFATANVAFSAYANANAALAEANAFQSVINSAFATANVAFSAYGRANASIGQQTTYIANTSQPGLTVNNGVTITLTGNNTLILGANAATTAEVGVVQLTDVVTSQSTTTAGTANAVNTVWATAQAAFVIANDALNLAESAFNKANSGGGSGGSLTVTYIANPGLTVNSGTSLTISGNGTVVFAANAATVNEVGIVQLTDNVDANLTTTAATANSVNTVWATAQAAFQQANTAENAATAAFAEANGFQSIINSAFSRANVSPSLGSITVTATSGLAVGGGSTLTLTSNGTFALTGNAATTGAVGVVQLTDVVTSTSATTAGTANAVNTVWATAQAAFVEANAFQSVINSAYATANVVITAYSNANAALAEANAFQSIINSAYSTANTAMGGYAEANAFQSIINSAFAKANTSVQKQTDVMTGVLTVGSLTSVGNINGAYVDANIGVTISNANGTLRQTQYETSGSIRWGEGASGDIENAAYVIFSSNAQFTGQTVISFNTTKGSNTINLVPGMYVYGTNVAPLTQITSISTNVSVTFSLGLLGNTANQQLFYFANNAGSLYEIWSYNDFGNTVAPWILVQRSNGLMTVQNLISNTWVSATQIYENGVEIGTGLQSAYNLINSTTNLVTGAYANANAALAEANGFQSIINSAYSRANVSPSLGSITVTATSGVAVGGGSTATLTSNGTFALTGNTATTGAVGVVQLTDSVTSTSTTTAATANAVNTAWAYAQSAFARANVSPSLGSITVTATGGVAVGGGSTATLTSNGTFALTANAATTAQVGVVELTDVVTSTSTTTAATANAVNTVWAYAQSAFARANVVGSVDSITVTATGGIAVGGGSTQTITSNGTFALTGNAATTGAAGVVQLTDSVLSTSATTAATANAVNTAWATAQSAFYEANAFQSVINSAFATANVAFSAYAQANVVITAYSNANAALAEANAFQSIINSAYSTANTAMGGYVEANAFQSIINSAYSTANTAMGGYVLANTLQQQYNPANNVVNMSGNANTHGVGSTVAYANGNFANIGDAQFGTTLVRIQTGSSANTYNLSTTGANSTSNVYGSINQIQLGNNFVYFFTAKIVARDVTNMFAKIWEVKGGIKNVVGAKSTTPVSNTNIMGTPIINIIAADNGTNNWTIGPSVDFANNALIFQATGSANTTNWVARVDLVEVG